MIDKTKAGKLMFFPPGVAFSLNILYFSQQWFGNK